MEDVLDVYQRRYDPLRPQLCVDETSKQLVGSEVAFMYDPFRVVFVLRAAVFRGLRPSALPPASHVSPLRGDYWTHPSVPCQKYPIVFGGPPRGALSLGGRPFAQVCAHGYSRWAPSGLVRLWGLPLAQHTSAPSTL